MWSYFGAKTNVIDRYPPPKFDKIIEPFAGTARYALKYFDRDITIIDNYKVLIDIWLWLKLCSKLDITSLPRLKRGENIDDFTFDCQEAKNLVGFLVNKGLNYPRKTASSWVTTYRPNWFTFNYKLISENLFKIKHWNIQLGSYANFTNPQATWFVDPPYQHGGEIYVMNNKSINYLELAEWCKSRKGHIIVCENSKADWMDFKEIISQKVRKGMQTEVIWSNYPTAFDHQQIKLDL